MITIAGELNLLNISKMNEMWWYKVFLCILENFAYNWYNREVYLSAKPGEHVWERGNLFAVLLVTTHLNSIINVIYLPTQDKTSSSWLDTLETF